MLLQQGQVVAGRFRLERELGQGGMGSVWRATHESLDMPVALKFVVGSAAGRDDVRERFKLEARAAARLNDPHVVKMLDFGLWDELPFIAMELLDGENLGERLSRVPQLSRSETLAIADNVAAALEAAHAAGIIHRDLKPENIFLLRSGGVVAKVLDFGIAKLDGMEAAPLTMTGALLGTPHYMSPEQAHGAKKVDYRADLWSLAVVVYQCLIGQRPFEGESLGELICTILSGHLPVPSDHGPVPRAFDDWWRTAAAVHPQDRFTNATAMVAALRAALSEPLPNVITTADGTRLGDLSRCDTDPVPRSTTANVVGPPVIPSLPVALIAPSLPPPSDTLGGSVRPAPLGRAPSESGAAESGAAASGTAATSPARRTAVFAALGALLAVGMLTARHQDGSSEGAEPHAAASPTEVVAPNVPQVAVPSAALPPAHVAPITQQPVPAAATATASATGSKPKPRVALPRARPPGATTVKSAILGPGRAAPAPDARDAPAAADAAAPESPPPAARSWSTDGQAPTNTTVTGTTTMH